MGMWGLPQALCSGPFAHGFSSRGQSGLGRAARTTVGGRRTGLLRGDNVPVGLRAGEPKPPAGVLGGTVEPLPP